MAYDHVFCKGQYSSLHPDTLDQTIHQQMGAYPLVISTPTPFREVNVTYTFNVATNYSIFLTIKDVKNFPIFGLLNKNMKAVLYVDDETNNLEAFKAAFRRDFDVFLASSADEARQILDANEIAVLITDQRMPSETGTQLLRKAVEKYPDQVRVLVTAYSDMEAIVAAVNEGYIFKYHKKPWNEGELRLIIHEACEKYHRIKELKNKEIRYKEILKELSGQSENQEK